MENFKPEEDSKHNADRAIELLDSIIHKRGIVDLSEGARKFGRRMSRKKGINLLDYFVFTSFGRKGWMVLINTGLREFCHPCLLWANIT